MPQTLIDAIKQAQKEQNWQKVIELCDELHQQSPEKWESLWWAGHAHKNLRQYIQAEEWFTKLKIAFPNRHLGLEGWVNVAEHQQNWAEMSQRVDAFEAQYPDLWHVPFWRGMIAKNTQRFDEAERHYALLAQKRPEWHVGWEEPVKMAFQRGDYRRAIELNPTFQAAFPHLWQSYWWVGQSYKNLGLYDEAMAQFAQFKEKSPQNHHGWEGEINIAQHQQNWQRVIELATAFQAAFPQMWHGFWWAGQAHKNLAQYDLAAQQFGLLKEKFPKQHQGLEGEINIAQHQQNWQHVIELATEFQAAFPQMWQGFWWAGQAHKNLAQYDLAAQQFGLLKEKFPKQHQGLEGEINIAQHQQNWQRVIELATAFQAAFPQMWHGFWWAGQAHKNLAQYDLAAQQFGLLKEKFPKQHQGLEGEINIAQHQQNWQRVIELATAFQAAFPQMWQGFWWAGQAHKNLAQYELALQQFELLKEKFPKQHQGLEGEINIAQHQQDWQRVIELATAFQAVFPQMWQGFWWAGQAHKNLGQYDLALQQFELLKEKFPKNHQGLEGEINIAQHQQNWQRVIELATEFQAAFPQMWQGFWWAGQAHKDLAQYAQALQEFETLKEKRSKQHHGWEGEINVAQYQQDWLKVIELVKSFQTVFPHMWQGYWWLGLAHTYVAQYDLASRQFELLKTQYPNLHYGWEGEINVAKHQQDKAQVLTLCQNFVARFAHLPFAHYVLIGEFFDRGLLEEATAQIQEMQQQHPHHPYGEQLALRCDCLIKNKMDVQAKLTQYFDKHKNNRAHASFIAHTQILLGAYDDAKSFFLDELSRHKLHPNKRHLFATLAGICQSQGKREESIAYWKQFRKELLQHEKRYLLIPDYSWDESLPEMQIHRAIQSQNMMKAHELFTYHQNHLNKWDKLRFESWFQFLAQIETHEEQSNNQIINCLWIGNDLNVIQQLCLKSFMYHGHEVHLYCYQDFKNVPKGVVIRDANEILPASEIYYSHNSVAHFSDWFRWRLLNLRGGYWADMDALCINPFNFDEEYVFGYETHTIATGILKFPRNDLIVHIMEYISAYPNEILPWDTEADINRKLYRKEKELGREYVLWGESSGPVGLTRALEYFALDKWAKPYYYFYPFNGSHTRRQFLDNDFNPDELFDEHIYATHIWNSYFSRFDMYHKSSTGQNMVDYFVKKYGV